MPAIFVSLEDEFKIFLYLKITFACSLPLHCLSLYLLVTRTPPNQIVTILLVNDVHLEVGIHGIPILQALAGYCIGLLPRMGVRPHVTVGILVGIWIYIGVAIILCIVYRHQTVMLAGNAFKLRKRTLIILHAAMMTTLPIPAVVWSVNGHDDATSDRLLLESSWNVSWIRDRGFYYLEERELFVPLGMSACIMTLIGCTVICLTVFFHMFYMLSKDSIKRSSRSSILIRRSLINLFVQLVIPLSLFVIPAICLSLAIIFEHLFTFEASLIIYLIIPLHSIGHNIILLSVNSSYRELFTSLIRKHFLCGRATVAHSMPISRELF